MSASESNAAGDPVVVDGEQTDQPPLEHTIVEGDDGGVECTIYPEDCDEVEILTNWITGSEGDFVSLAEML